MPRSRPPSTCLTSPPPNGKGLTCVNCHGIAQTHGDGTPYKNQYDSPNTLCTDCHAAETLSQTLGHAIHGQNMTCAACHAQTVVSCQGCHLNAVVAGAPEFPNARVFGWKFLVVNNDGKYELGNVMTAVWTTEKNEVKTHVAVAPYYDHSIGKPKTREDKIKLCASCHNNANIAAYTETGSIVISKWDAEGNKMAYPTKGVVPIPADYKTALKVAFPVISNIDEVVQAVKDGKPPAEVEKVAKWALGKEGADQWQLNYCKPLDKMPKQFTQEQLEGMFPKE